MTGQQKIFVDFNTRGPEGRYYVADLGDFPDDVDLGHRFEATDYEEFDGVACVVIGIRYTDGTVLLRPVDPTAVPGTFDPATYEAEPAEPLLAELVFAGVVEAT